jgi:hypothetical protein
MKELLFGMALCALYTALLLSMNPEWVGWAAPLVFGGALVASGPPPVPVFSAPPREVFEMASSMSLFSLLALGLLSAIRGERGVGRFARARQSLETGLLTLGTRVLRRVKLRGSPLGERCYPPGAVVASAREAPERHALRATSGCSVITPPERPIVRRAPRMGDQEVLQPLHGEAVSAGSNDLR